MLKGELFCKRENEKIAQLEEELQKKDAELNELRIQLLQKEIRPHFIFNTLLSIKQLCIEEPRLAADALQDFSVYLRKRLESMASPECVPFSEELDIVKSYIALEKIEPTVDFTVQYDLSYTDFDVPLLSVQPMVENAVRHGIDTVGGDGIVTIKTFLENGCAIIEVSDNGTGEENETPQQAKHRGIGITNTKDRIRLMCHGDMDIVYTGRGTIVRYTIPVE